jgi:hypothetical protein
MRRILFGVVVICGSVLLLPAVSGAQGTSMGIVAGSVTGQETVIVSGATPLVDTQRGWTEWS